MTALIEARGISKRFRQHKRFPGLLGAFKSLVTTEYTEVTAVSDISFDITAGEAVGYLGPNGAGKSTMIKMMTGILLPSAGTLSVLGRTPHAERMANARQIGVVFGQRSQLWWDLPLLDSFTLHQRIYEIPAARYQDNLKRFSALLDLTPFLDRAVRQLSLGQRMRAEIVMSLLHDPKILFLDEPTIGLDVVAKDAVRKFLAEINRERGVTIILTTHDLQDIETICPRLIMVDQARLIFDGELTRLRSALGSARRLTLEFASDPGPVPLSSATLTSDEGLRKHYLLERDDVSLVQVLGEVGSDRDLKDVALHEPDIEEVIRTFYQRRNAAAAAAQ
ncbi:ABC-2 type transport system ATP-binding protein [Devosia sp. YR412]|uniref:ABC transporter ATP-binding protein n=1 Tax=Devosia sp. YR412 TaxID=1881030 RepID=UPI0008CC052E|nr:ATP-binding cassette domain-containing protein [Devosia sp. YR412]SEQ14130.1 ABC-2 type transport system ATP-binding protein [Devosia sp. YR412]